MSVPRGELVFISGRYRGQRVPIRHEVLRIGRDRSCELALDDEAASRVHSEIARKGGQYVIRDMHSTNGTFVNDARITELNLQNGDRIAVGDTTLLLQIENQEERHTPQIVFAKEQKPTSARMSISLNDTKFLELKEGTSINEAQKQFSTLYEFMVDIAGILHLPALLDRALGHFFKAFNADRGLILLLTADGEPGLKVAKLRQGAIDDDKIMISRTMAHQLLQKKESFVSMDATSDERLAGSVSLANMKVKSVMGAPLKVKDKVTGMLYFDTIGSANPFSETDLKLCTAMAVQLAVCVENSRLYNELLDAAQFNDSILRSLQSGIIVLDITGRILRVNQATQDILLKTDQQLLGRTIGEFPELGELARVMTTTLMTGTAEDRNEVPVKVGADTLPLGLSTSALSDHTGKIIGAVANFRNLSVIRKLEEQVRRSQHLASLGQMAAGVAHEIRNPLNTIRGYTQLLQEKSSDEASRAEYTQIILEEVDRMNRIIQDLLDFSRQRDLTLVPVPIDALMQDLVKAMQHDAQQRKVTLSCVLDDTIWPNVLGNQDKLRQVFRNIILNGIQACKPEGSVTIRLSIAEEPLLVSKDQNIAAAPTHRKLAVAIEDTGSGIDPVYMQKIFDPFFTQKETGTGLGLSISQKIVDQHGGRIEVKSELGKGSTFTVLLPAV
ncbi:MAG TPA: ATP-binding protein [Planctomycetota bacterium]|nr:ATP-binding protein [Planctomycetota bacterium]